MDVSRGKTRRQSKLVKSCLLLPLICVVLVVDAHQGNRHPAHRYTNTNNYYVAAASQQVPQVSGGYNYAVPQVAATVARPQTVVKPTSQASVLSTGGVKAEPQQQQQQQQQAAQTVVPSVTTSQSVSGSGSVKDQALDSAAATAAENSQQRQLHVEHSAQIKNIDVACGKERMTVRISFDQTFNGIIYAKGHYNDPNCRFVGSNSGQRMYQFEMTVGTCGVAFIDSGLTSGGQAYLEGLLVIIMEPGVQEAWDIARRIRCLWEGNIDQTVTFPLSVNMLDSQTLTFSGDTASASLEIQSGRGPRAQSVQGLVRIGDLLTAVVTVQGDPDFDILVRNCVATDGTPNNRVILSDNRGCATKPKLMGGWLKQRNAGSIFAYSYLSAFKFPDLMDLFLECTVSLCKGTCDECPEFHELHVHHHDGPNPTSGGGIQGGNGRPNIDERLGGGSARVKRNSLSGSNSSLVSPPQESLQLRRVVHVVSPDDFPEFLTGAAPATTNSASGVQSDQCLSLITIMAAVFIGLLLLLTSAVLFSLFSRRNSAAKSIVPEHQHPIKYYTSSSHRP